jgi:mRNA-degrading endonuclease RelE of RelBE toxin-antitoxin system
VKKAFNTLSIEQKQGVFDAIRPLLEAENPYSVVGVKKLKGKFSNLWRVRARNHRVFFIVKVIVDENNPYKGNLEIHAIVARKDAY